MILHTATICSLIFIFLYIYNTAPKATILFFLNDPAPPKISPLPLHDSLPISPLDVGHWLGPKPLPLSQLRGKTLLLFFWAHWCSDCKRLLPDLVRLAAEFGPKGLRIIEIGRAHV